MQLTQSKETNKQAEQPATVSHAEPPSGKEFGSIIERFAGSRAFSALFFFFEEAKYNKYVILCIFEVILSFFARLAFFTLHTNNTCSSERLSYGIFQLFIL